MIKKITFLVAFVAATFSSNAQFNFDVNSWSDNVTPTGWFAFLNGNIETFGDTSVVQTTGRTGSAAKMKPIDLSAFNFPALSLFQYGETGNGVAISAEFDSVFFYAKQVIGNTDLVGNVTCVTTQLDGDTVATGTINVEGDVANFTRYAFEMIYYPGMEGQTADSLKLDVLNVATAGDFVGIYSIFDDFGLIGATGSVSLNELKKEEILVFPTLTSDEVNVNLGSVVANKILVYSLDGREVLNSEIEGQSKTISLKNSPNGTYLYHVLNGDSTVKSGKIVLNK